MASENVAIAKWFCWWISYPCIQITYTYYVIVPKGVKSNVYVYQIISYQSYFGGVGIPN